MAEQQATQEQVEQTLTQLKARLFDAEDAARQNAQTLQEVVGFVAQRLDLGQIQSLEEFGKAIDAKFPETSEETDAVEIDQE